MAVVGAPAGGLSETLCMSPILQTEVGDGSTQESGGPAGRRCVIARSGAQRRTGREHSGSPPVFLHRSQASSLPAPSLPPDRQIQIGRRQSLTIVALRRGIWNRCCLAEPVVRPTGERKSGEAT